MLGSLSIERVTVGPVELADLLRLYIELVPSSCLTFSSETVQLFYQISLSKPEPLRGMIVRLERRINCQRH